MERHINNEHYSIWHLYKVCDIARVKLFFWLQMPEFVERIRAIDPTYRSITKDDVLKVVKEVYALKEAHKDPDFSLPRARRTIRALEQKIAEENTH